MPPKAKPTKDTSTANLGFEQKLWLTADKLRNNMDAAEYKLGDISIYGQESNATTRRDLHPDLRADYAGLTSLSRANPVTPNLN